MHSAEPMRQIDARPDARLPPLYRCGPIDVAFTVRAMPRDGLRPVVDEWPWLDTPGHAPGHVSMFRPRDRVLIAGVAIVTTRQEALLAGRTQEREVWRPPASSTIVWPTAEVSTRLLDVLAPSGLAAGHGRARRRARVS
jgi:glyoxylase-like metal-dependent hydrolase (beta-lactamase superfamily II)